MSKLTEKDVIDIRVKYQSGTTKVKIMEEYSISRPTVDNILRRKGIYKNII